MGEERTRVAVLDVPIDVMTKDQALERVLSWARRRLSRSVAVCNVHVVVTASRDAGYRGVIAAADMACPDGAPVAWMLRRLGYRAQRRIPGPDLMWALCERCAVEGLAIYFYGSERAVLEALERRLAAAFPALRIAGMESPPFRPLTEAEDAAVVHRMNTSGASIVFVGLGCPKQEQWIAAHRDKVEAAMIGVGAAFDFHAGTKVRAPGWIQALGLEWLHRLLSEPRRLGRRYLVTNTLFLAGIARQLLTRGR